MSSAPTILCCLCGKKIEPNEAAMCIECLRNQVDITSDIETESEMIQCGKCDRWWTARDTWTHHELESSGLLAVCLKKIKGLSKTKIINAVWVWTEPHSKRLKIAVDIEKPVLDGKMNIQQRVIIEYIVRNKQCLECIREASDHSWGAMIQLRQKSDHKSSLMALETLLTRAGLHNIMLGAEVSKNGMDFYFRNRSQAEKLVNFISSNLPTKIKQSQRLVSTDSHSGQSKYEHVYLIEVPSLCKGDLVKVGKSGGVPAELMVVSKVSTSLHLISPTTLRKLEISSSKFFSNPIKAIRSSYQQVMFVVLDIEPVNPSDMSTMRSNEYDYDESTLKTNAYSTAGGLLAEAEIAKLSDFGVNDTTYRVRTHLGHILKAGDNVLGYDLVTAVSDQEELRKVLDNSPDMILIRKSYENDGEKAKKKRNRRRKQSSAASVKPTHDDILADDLVAEDVEDLQKVLDETDVRNGKSDENGHLDFEEDDDDDDFDDNGDDIDMKALDGMDLIDEEHNNSRNHETQINIALKGDVNIQS